MSSMMRGNGRERVEASCNGIVRRMVSLPRSILGGFSRVMDQGIDLMRLGVGGRRNQHHLPSNFPLPQLPEPVMVQEEFAFLANFELNYGTMHPFFYACRFMEALKMAQDERKCVFMYLHAPEHPFTPSFCRETLCAEVVIQFLDANFVCWGGLSDRGEGLQMATTLRPASFPFCAVVAPVSGDNLAVLQQMEGPVTPAELVEILQRTMEEQGSAFGGAWAKEEEKRRADRRLREEQDTAYLTALQIDKEKDRLKNSTSEERVQKKASNVTKDEKFKQNPIQKQDGQVREGTTARETPQKDIASKGKEVQATKIQIRFPTGERKEQSFLCTDKVSAIYRYIDSLGLTGVGSYRLVSSFPRKTYDVQTMGTTLKDAGLHPKASLFLELL